MKVALQPASRTDARTKRNFEATIDTPVRLDDHHDVLDPRIRAQLLEQFPNGEARLWGVTPGKEPKRVNSAKVGMLQPGDFVLFYGEGRFYLAATIAVRWDDVEFAERLWGRDDKNQTWQHMYALTDVRDIDVHIDEVRAPMGWGPTAIVQGFNVYRGDKADFLSELCNLELNELAPTDDEPDPGPPLSHDGELETKVAVKQRREQRKLRKRLNKLGATQCALCGRELPQAFLVAAHIKPRHRCTDEEKRDLDNVGMLACVFGCDSLYEHGYIAVGHGGSILVSDRVSHTPAVQELVETHLTQQQSTWWTPSREHYFAWHRTHTFISDLGDGTSP